MLKRNDLRFLLICFFLATTLFLFGDLPTSTIPITAAQSSQLNRIESDHAAVGRVGQWTALSTTSASGGRYLYSSGAVADTLTLDFVGTTVEISYVKNAGLGSFAIEIDNVLRRTVVTTNDQTSFDNRAIIDYLEDGRHTLKVYAVDGVIAIDAFFATLPTPEIQRIEIAPPATTLVSPLGSTSSNPPEFIWNAVSGSTWYYLYVNGPNGNIIKLWISAANANCPAGTGQCSTTPSVTQIGGTHDWWVQTYGDAYGQWSDKGTYTQNNGMLPPAVISTVSPTGDTATNMPTYTWNADPWAEWYYLWVGQGPTNVNVVAKWYSRAEAGCASGTGTCSVTPTTRLARGTHRWYMQGWDPLGYGPWNGEAAFNVTVGPPQTAATLIAPDAPTSTNQPTFTWNAVAEANQYRLYVSGPGGFVFDQTMTAASFGCPAGTGICTYSPSGALLTTGGTHSWWVHSLNDWGGGLWSTNKSFTYTAIAPVAVTQIAPIGAIDHVLPIYEWNADPNASWYQLWVGIGSTNVVSVWYSRAQAGCGSGTGTCSVQPTTSYLLPGSAYMWYVQAYNTTAIAWTGAQNFNLTNQAGFVDYFTTASGNWTPTHTTPWTTNFGHYFTDPSTVDSWSTSFYSPQTYDNFDYYARLYRTGCLWCETGVIVRGTPTPLGFGNSWRSGYGFFIDQEGYFVVMRFDPDTDPTFLSGTLVDPWVHSHAILHGPAYNSVRILAQDDDLKLYVNGVLVWSGIDGTYSSGNVGVAMKRGNPNSNPGNTGEVYADWAVLYRLE